MTLLSTRYAALNYLLPDDPPALLKEPHVYQCLGKSSDASADGPGTTGSSAVASGEEIQNSLRKTLEKRTRIIWRCLSPGARVVTSPIIVFKIASKYF